jgi:hypothetical protein
MTLQESINNIKDLLIKTKEADDNLEFFIDSYLALLYKQVEEYINCGGDLNFIKDIIKELKEYKINTETLLNN